MKRREEPFKKTVCYGRFNEYTITRHLGDWPTVTVVYRIQIDGELPRALQCERLYKDRQRVNWEIKQKRKEIAKANI